MSRQGRPRAADPLHLIVVHPFREADGSVTDNLRWACGRDPQVWAIERATNDKARVTCALCRKSHHFTGAVNYRGRW